MFLFLCSFLSTFYLLSCHWLSFFILAKISFNPICILSSIGSRLYCFVLSKQILFYSIFIPLLIGSRIVLVYPINFLFYIIFILSSYWVFVLFWSILSTSCLFYSLFYYLIDCRLYCCPILAKILFHSIVYSIFLLVIVYHLIGYCLFCFVHPGAFLWYCAFSYSSIGRHCIVEQFYYW